MSKIANSFILFFLIVAGATLSIPAYADRLSINNGVSRDNNMPARGATMKIVAGSLGMPIKKIPAVGKPAISRWQYAAFTVYFENNRVLHSVVSR